MDVSEPDSGVVEVEKPAPETSEAVAVEKEAEGSAPAAESLDAELSVPPSNAAVGSEAPAQVYDIPRSGEDQPGTPASWKNCCGLLDVVRGSNQ